MPDIVVLAVGLDSKESFKKVSLEGTIIANNKKNRSVKLFQGKALLFLSVN